MCHQTNLLKFTVFSMLLCASIVVFSIILGTTNSTIITKCVFNFLRLYLLSYVWIDIHSLLNHKKKHKLEENQHTDLCS